MERVKVGSGGFVLYDTTLRDGAQAEGISFSVGDKLKIAEKLDNLGIHYIEGGWPGSNPKDVEFFRAVKQLHLKNARISAFGSTRRKGENPSHDENLRKILKAGTPAVAIFGKSWTVHVHYVLKTGLEENLKMIEDSIKLMKKEGREVFFDAEHFFDGYKTNPDYAVKTLKSAEEAGAHCLILCDTNGGTMPLELKKIIEEIKPLIKAPFGIHAHNDSDSAVANTLIAVASGATHVQGTINGYGERCGNANLCSVIPNLKIKMAIDCISDEKLRHITETSRYVAEIANLLPSDKQPYVGASAFAHKGGMHADAVDKHSPSYEHIEPERVGNARRILISELAGKTSVLKAAIKESLVEKDSPEMKKILILLKELESKGYEFEAADGSFHLLIKKAVGKYKRFFRLEGFRVIVEKREDNTLISEATIKVKVKGKEEHTAALGDGPVNALDNALRKALEEFYPSLSKMRLTDFKVRVLGAKGGTAAKVRVLIESKDGTDKWGTVGVSENIIEASWQAMVDSIEYKLSKDKM